MSWLLSFCREENQAGPSDLEAGATDSRKTAPFMHRGPSIDAKSAPAKAVDQKAAGTATAATGTATAAGAAAPRRFGALVLEGMAGDAHDRRAGPLIVSFGMITGCTAVYFRQGDYCAFAHMKGLTYNDALMNKIITNVSMDGQNSSIDREAIIYFSHGVNGKPFKYLSQNTVAPLKKFSEVLEANNPLLACRYYIYDPDGYNNVYLDLDGKAVPNFGPKCEPIKL